MAVIFYELTHVVFAGKLLVTVVVVIIIIISSIFLVYLKVKDVFCKKA